MVRLGIVGLGYWGPNLLRNFDSIKECNVKYCCDLSEDNLSHVKAQYPNVETTDNYETLLRDEDLDAIVIATPASTHYKETS